MGNMASASDISPAPSPLPTPLRSFAQPLIPFTVTEVSLAPSSPLHFRAVSNAQYLLSLDVDRLLYTFRTYAGLDLRGAKPYGGWESPANGGRGCFAGHALGAYALASASLRATRPDLAQSCVAKAAALVTGFAEIQAAIGKIIAPQPFGYLYAESPALFDKLEALQQVSVPYYVVHKLMAGLVAAHRWTGDAKALAIVSAMADYHSWRMTRLTAERIEAMIDTRR